MLSFKPAQTSLRLKGGASRGCCNLLLKNCVVVSEMAENIIDVLLEAYLLVRCGAEVGSLGGKATVHVRVAQWL